MLDDEKILAKCWGEEIASLRRKMCRKQEEVAKSVGISSRWLYKIEYGLASGRLYTYERIVKELGKDFADVRIRVMQKVLLEQKKYGKRLS